MANAHISNLLDSYIEQVANPRDKVLFTEAIQAAEASALRAAYMMLWLACVESWKWKLQELATRNLEAAKVIEEIENLEFKKQPTHEYLLKQANKFGLLMSKHYSKLEHIYILQRAYSRPYEKHPKMEEFITDASTVIDGVLGRPPEVQASHLLEKIHILSHEINALTTSLKQQKTV